MSAKFMKYVRPQLAEEFKRVRQEKNLSTAEVALKSRFSLETIEQIEQGQEVRFGYYEGLSKFYGKTIKFSLE